MHRIFFFAKSLNKSEFPSKTCRLPRGSSPFSFKPFHEIQACSRAIRLDPKQTPVQNQNPGLSWFLQILGDCSTSKLWRAGLQPAGELSMCCCCLQTSQAKHGNPAPSSSQLPLNRPSSKPLEIRLPA